MVLDVEWVHVIMVRGRITMYCTKCGAEIKSRRIRIPRKCAVCGAKFEMVFNIGVIIYLVLSLLSILIIVYLFKQIINVEWILYVLLAFEIVLIPNIIENFLAKIHLIKYKNLR